jgi:aldehyde dehydrogenase (NAD+)
MKYQNLINGKWVDSGNGKTFPNINPADSRDLVGEFPESTSEDTSAAIGAASKAFESWRLTPAPKRAEILFRAAQNLVLEKDNLARDMTREMGKVLKEAAGDVQEAIDMTYYIAGEGRRLHGHTTPSELPDKYMMSVRVPLELPRSSRPGIFQWRSLPGKLFLLS